MNSVYLIMLLSLIAFTIDVQAVDNIVIKRGQFLKVRMPEKRWFRRDRKMVIAFEDKTLEIQLQLNDDDRS